MSEGSGVLAIILFFIGIIIYFLPAFNASSRKHPNTSSIFLLNLFLGWTLVGWVAALVWSASAIAKPEKSQSKTGELPEIDRYDALEKIASMKERGLISEDEYQAEKTRLLRS